VPPATFLVRRNQKKISTIFKNLDLTSARFSGRSARKNRSRPSGRFGKFRKALETKRKGKLREPLERLREAFLELHEYRLYEAWCALVGAARNFNERDADIAAMYWNRRRGEHGKIRDRNTLEAYDSLLRDWQEKDALIAKHLDQRGTLKAQQDKDAERFERIERDLKLGSRLIRATR
jgi:hypothetical protein